MDYVSPPLFVKALIAAGLGALLGLAVAPSAA